jgi:glycosyltransferase involved in cell wall biosynthesis
VSGRGITLVYAGSTRAWGDIRPADLLLRENCLLEAFVCHPGIKRVLVVKQVTRSTFWRKLISLRRGQKPSRTKVKDIFLCSLLPERTLFHKCEAINRALKKTQFRLQAGPLIPDQTVVWCFWPEAARLATELCLSGFRVFDADYNIVEDINRDDRKHLRASVLQCVKTADLVVAGSRSLLAWASRNGARSTGYLRNGVNLQRFEIATKEPLEIRNLPRPRIGYVGGLSKWVDFELLEGLALRHREWNFVVIGGWHALPGREQLGTLGNVKLLGPKGADEVPHYLSHLDIGLALYKQGLSWLDGDSMKLYEYLAAGLPVVSTPFHADVESDFEHLLEIAIDVREYENAISHLLNRPREQAEDWRQRCRRFLQSNTWTCRAGEAMRLAETGLRGRSAGVRHSLGILGHQGRSCGPS